VDGSRSSFNLNIEEKGGAGPVTEIRLSVISVNAKGFEAQQSAVAARAESVAAALIQQEHGVPLYSGATLQIKAMEIYMRTMQGGVEGYWFPSKDLPDEVPHVSTIGFYKDGEGGR